MTKQEAIDRIEDHMRAHKIGEYPHIRLAEALKMAIAALRAQQEPVKPLGGEAAPGLSGPEARPRLDRSRWEGCEWCKTYGFGAVVFDGQKYCGYCGRPLTEEAWAELERRINDGTNDLCKAFAQLEPREISH